MLHSLQNLTKLLQIAGAFSRRYGEDVLCHLTCQVAQEAQLAIFVPKSQGEGTWRLHIMDYNRPRLCFNVAPSKKLLCPLQGARCWQWHLVVRTEVVPCTCGEALRAVSVRSPLARRGGAADAVLCTSIAKARRPPLADPVRQSVLCT